MDSGCEACNEWYHGDCIKVTAEESQFIKHWYCNICCGELLTYIYTLLRKLQSVQNATARLITGTRRRDHIMPVLCELHWLPIRERIKFKVACLVRQSRSGHAPVYLADDCCLVSDSTRRSADVPTCMLPQTLSSYGDRTFAAAGPRLWNTLPVQLRSPDITYELFIYVS